ncbi:MAG: ribosomal protein S18-alanine N-acetyltransferase [Halanaerobiaceae bacterium]|nr:ribosomal protein S18-alanine N-acetyltransferase [Halanaerobiaceae bacterium]
MTGNRIVPMAITHLERVMEIEKDSFSDPWSRGSFVSEITENPYAVYFVALEGELVIAYIGGWLLTGELHITNLAVDKDYRRRGIAERLIEKILLYSSNKGIKAATLEVRVSNISAINLYKKMGFIPVGSRPGYYLNNNEDALIMWKKY